VIEPAEVTAEPAVFERIGEERTFEVEAVPPQLFPDMEWCVTLTLMVVTANQFFQIN
jgi:hypothetical protein